MNFIYNSYISIVSVGTSYKCAVMLSHSRLMYYFSKIKLETYYQTRYASCRKLFTTLVPNILFRLSYSRP